MQMNHVAWELLGSDDPDFGLSAVHVYRSHPESGAHELIALLTPKRFMELVDAVPGHTVYSVVHRKPDTVRNIVVTQLPEGIRTCCPRGAAKERALEVAEKALNFTKGAEFENERAEYHQKCRRLVDEALSALRSVRG